MGKKSERETYTIPKKPRLHPTPLQKSPSHVKVHYYYNQALNPKTRKYSIKKKSAYYIGLLNGLPSLSLIEAKKIFTLPTSKY